MFKQTVSVDEELGFTVYTISTRDMCLMSKQTLKDFIPAGSELSVPTRQSLSFLRRERDCVHLNYKLKMSTSSKQVVVVEGGHQYSKIYLLGLILYPHKSIHGWRGSYTDTGFENYYVSTTRKDQSYCLVVHCNPLKFDVIHLTKHGFHKQSLKFRGADPKENNWMIACFGRRLCLIGTNSSRPMKYRPITIKYLNCD